MKDLSQALEEFNRINNNLSNPEEISTNPADYEENEIYYAVLNTDTAEYFKQIWHKLLQDWIEKIKKGDWSYCVSLTFNTLKEDHHSSEDHYVIKFLVSNTGMDWACINPPQCISFKIRVLSKSEEDNLYGIDTKGSEYIKKFVKKYQDDWDEKDLLNLCKLVSQKADDVLIKDLKMHVCKEERKQDFKRFSKRFSEIRRKTFEDYLEVFSCISNEDFSFYEEKRKKSFKNQFELIKIVKKTIRLSKKISYFKQLIQEKMNEDVSRISDFDLIIDLIKSSDEKLRLKKFEDNLSKSVVIFPNSKTGWLFTIPMKFINIKILQMN